MATDEAVPQELLDSIAIVGMAGRFPGAPDLDRLWENLAAGVESISYFSDEELEAAGVDLNTVRDAPNYVRAQARLDDYDLFDAAFFGVNTREAEQIDPQHRLLLETAWHALEDAGYDPFSYDGSIGVFAGSNKNSYYVNNVHPNRAHVDPVGIDQTELANEKDYLTTRLSYKLNLRGPSISIHTACSTSLVATFYAYQALLNYQCDMALAGGVCLLLPQTAGYWHSETSILSPDGRCRPYDANAHGTVGGSGVGVVVLKRLADAVADGDHIRAVIRGMAVNNDGASKLSFGAPSVDGQAEVIAMAQAIAGIDPGTITYIEGHGTGTPLGDPIEVTALTQAFRRGTSKTNFCALGSIKSNFGHLVPAAGVAALIKTVLCFEHRAIPPLANFERPNPRLELGGSPFYIADRLRKWESTGPPLRAGVSSFGVGGTNAHAVLEEAPAIRSGKSPRRSQLLCVSARSAAAVDRAAERLAAHLAARPDIDMADVAFSLHVGRRAFDHRRFVVCDSAPSAVAALRGGTSGVVADRKVADWNPAVCVVYDQGGEMSAGVAELYAAEPVFARHVEQCLTVLGQQAGEAVALERIPHASATYTVIAQYALTQLWASWGIHANAAVGQGAGCISVACTSRVMSLEHALLVATRLDSGANSADAMTGIELNVPAIPIVAGATSGWLTPAQARNGDFWTASTLRSESGALPAALFEDTARAFLLVGAGGRLAAAIESHPARQQHRVAAHSANGVSGAALLSDLGQFWCAGGAIDWSALYTHEQRVRVPLPTYPFERRRYWMDPPTARRTQAPPVPAAHVGNGAADSSDQVAVTEYTIPALHDAVQMEDVSMNGIPADGAARANRIIGELQDVVSELSGISHDDLDIDATFLELGFDSLFLTQANGEFQKRFPVKIAFHQLFEEAPTFRALAAYIDDQLPPEPVRQVQVKSVPTAALHNVAPATGLAAASPRDGSIEWLIEQQLKIMNEQLELLRSWGTPGE